MQTLQACLKIYKDTRERIRFDLLSKVKKHFTMEYFTLSVFCKLMMSAFRSIFFILLSGIFSSKIIIEIWHVIFPENSALKEEPEILNMVIKKSDFPTRKIPVVFTLKSHTRKNYKLKLLKANRVLVKFNQQLETARTKVTQLEDGIQQKENELQDKSEKFEQLSVRYEALVVLHQKKKELTRVNGIHKDDPVSPNDPIAVQLVNALNLQQREETETGEFSDDPGYQMNSDPEPEMNFDPDPEIFGTCAGKCTRIELRTYTRTELGTCT